jgi:hypothetical protein
MNPVQKTFRLSCNLLKVVLFNPSRLSHVLGTALAASEEVAEPPLDLLRLKTVTVEDLLPEKGDARIQIALFPKTNASVSLLEMMGLILLMKRIEASNVFEFGTYKGVSVTQMALNAAGNGRVLTLDLPDAQFDTRFGRLDAEDAELVNEKGRGILVPPEIRPSITFLKEDSATFDERPYWEEMDFVFVDGAHNREYVKNDSEKGWRMLRKGGIIAWHDCRPLDPAVVAYLLKSEFRPCRIAGTSLAFAKKPDSTRD